MLEVIRTLLESSPLLALFLAIATGYAVGQISFAGVSFGAGAVLFTGLVIGAFAPQVGAERGRRDSRPADVRLRDGHPVRTAILRESPRAGPQVHGAHLRRGGRLALRGAGGRRAARRLAGDRGRIVRGLRHQHAHAASRARGGRQSGSDDRLFRRVSVRGGRADHPDDDHGRAGETGVRRRRQAACDSSS